MSCESQNPGMSTSRAFPEFPFEPYDIQVEFMQSLFDALEGGKVAVFESPTGTGKSLSIICAALSWLKSAQQKHDNCEPVTTDENVPDWIREQVQQASKKQLQKKRDDWDAHVNRIRSRPQTQIPPKRLSMPTKKQVSIGGKLNQDDFIVTFEEEDSLFDAATSSSLLDLDRQDLPEPPDNPIKIFYCSRTHSQISQFVREIRKTTFAENLKVVSLGSRANLCTNDDVRSLGSIERINECCLDMQQKKASSCPYLSREPKAKLDFQANLLSSVKDIEEVADMAKNIGSCGYYGTRESVQPAEVVTLPYNLLLQKSAREALGIDISGQIVIFDEAHNISDAISSIYTVIITSTQVTKCIAQLARYTERYFNRMSSTNQLYVKQLGFVLENLAKFIASCESSGAKKETIMSCNEFVNACRIDNINVFKLQEYLKNSRLAQKLHGFCQSEDTAAAAAAAAQKPSDASSAGKISRGKRSQNSRESVPASKKSRSDGAERASLQRIEAFLVSLTNASLDGRILISRRDSVDESTPRSYMELKYLLLNPADVFSDITSQAKSVILAGGTMTPLEDFKAHLIPNLPAERFARFSCGHIIPASSIKTIIVSRSSLEPEALLAAPGRNTANMSNTQALLPTKASSAKTTGSISATAPTSQSILYDFSYDRRTRDDTLSILFEALLTFCQTIPDGLVVFFPSFSYLEHCRAWFAKRGGIGQFERYKKVFIEPRGSGDLDTVLQEYSRAIDDSKKFGRNGAMIMCVVSGKLSEGINFSDRLGRGIIVVGLPFANMASLELKEKLGFMERRQRLQQGPGQSSGSSFSKEYYENMCMRAVNQSIGRAIRHKQDFATIVLLDHRYSRVFKKLPGWIRDAGVEKDCSLQTAREMVSDFFART
ncbi:MAG: hypothetical protein SGCHY_001748 [Lobulomycetales sp.]